MAVFFEIKERRVIPNWRDFKRTLQLGELNQSNKLIKPIQLTIERSTEDWILNKNIGTAADIINSSFVSGIHNPHVSEAIQFVRLNNERTSPSLHELIKRIESSTLGSSKILNNSLLEIDVETINEFQTFINNKLFHKIINKTKNRTKNEINNPIVWVELARLYAMKGNSRKAENAIITALHLAPNNRFVLRSATRFFIHEEKFDKALFYLRKAENLKYDPWLISAHIATSSIMGRFSPVIKEGRKLIDSGNFSDFDLTELASSLGTLELKTGSFKRAKGLFNKSMIMPNDNSLAQLEWVSKDDKRLQINPFSFDKVINPFEAQALEFYERGNWSGAFYNSIKWFLDMPFSKRPVILGSYIAGSLLKDKNAAITLCKVGLQANPKDPTLLNNMVYNIATSGNTEMLDFYVQQMIGLDINGLPDASKITYQATLGLVALKKGQLELGIDLYKRAIQNATNLKNDYLKNLAIVNFANELINLKLPEQYQYIELVKNMKIEEKDKDLQLIKNDILDKIRGES